MSNEKVLRSRLKLILMALVILSPIVISSYLHRANFRPGHTINYGELLEVKPLQGEATNLLDNTIFRSRQLKGVWSLIMIDSGQCDAYCQEKLYMIRQARLAQHVDKDKVQRIWLINDDIKPSQEVISKYKGTRLVLANGRDLLKEFPFEARPEDHIYVVDPMGNLMMRYPNKPDAQKIVGDLKRLIKLSHPEH
ncbi:MAG: hypothetical protein IT527_09085 [Nitrosomonas sp.]|nr:hypothetical protein [Nitrosomonas sp.]